jgi:hypothetical protein
MKRTKFYVKSGDLAEIATGWLEDPELAGKFARPVSIKFARPVSIDAQTSEVVHDIYRQPQSER